MRDDPIILEDSVEGENGTTSSTPEVSSDLNYGRSADELSAFDYKIEYLDGTITIAVKPYDPVNTEAEFLYAVVNLFDDGSMMETFHYGEATGNTHDYSMTDLGDGWYGAELNSADYPENLGVIFNIGSRSADDGVNLENRAYDSSETWGWTYNASIKFTNPNPVE
ncbi:MAG: hypothetical protein NUK57_03325 [Gudongella sp.]|nr:hypothetical protein [Gudongella sp.]